MLKTCWCPLCYYLRILSFYDTLKGGKLETLCLCSPTCTVIHLYLWPFLLYPPFHLSSLSLPVSSWLPAHSTSGYFEVIFINWYDFIFNQILMLVPTIKILFCNKDWIRTSNFHLQFNFLLLKWISRIWISNCLFQDYQELAKSMTVLHRKQINNKVGKCRKRKPLKRRKLSEGKNILNTFVKVFLKEGYKTEDRQGFFFFQ